ncbi:MAG TPA: aminoacyl--tRNA ligase-related protein, partial [Micavibrio sp.]
HGFEEIDVPLMARPESMAATTHLPKFDNGFRTTDGYWLIPSAEVALINLYRDTILTADGLPIRMTALTPCFRSEAGAAGRDTRGMLRHHQFYKVELVAIAHPDKWKDEFDYIVACAEKVLQRLNLPYRLMQLCAGDCATKEAYAVDPEVWLPGQNRYREICTWACTTDYQSRRAQIRIRDGAQKIHPYIIYGSGTAVGRALIAVMENYQQEDGSILIPEALRPYMRGLEKIEAA